jgi:hypothetical protein
MSLMGWLLICSGQFKPLRMICCYWQCSGAKGLGTLGPELEHFTRALGGGCYERQRGLQGIKPQGDGLMKARIDSDVVVNNCSFEGSLP